MNEKIKKVKVWMEEHKKEIVITAGATVMTVGGIILFKTSKNAVDVKKLLKTELPNDWRPEKLNISEIGVGNLDDVMRYSDGTVELWMDNIPLMDMGNLGDAITAQIPDIPGDNKVWALLSVKPNIVE